jgi:hypothetical protein
LADAYAENQALGREAKADLLMARRAHANKKGWMLMKTQKSAKENT